MRTQTFDKLVRQVCNLRQDPKAKTYSSVAMTVKIVLNQLNLFIFNEYFKSQQLTVDSNLTVDFPSDLELWTKVGVIQSDGLPRIIGYNDDIVNPAVTATQCSCSTTSSDDSSESPYTSCPTCTFHNLYYGDTYLGEYYGWRSTQNEEGSVKADYGTSQLVFKGGTDIVEGATVILEYKPTMGAEELAVIPSDAFMVVFHKTNELMAAFRSPNAAMVHAQLFKKEYDAYKRIRDPHHPMDIVKAMRGAYTSSPSR